MVEYRAFVLWSLLCCRFSYKEGGKSIARHPNKTTAREHGMNVNLIPLVIFFSLCRIGHDNKGGFAGWFLDKVMIDVPSLGQRSVFPCGRWLDKNKDDGQLERELLPGTDTEETYTPCKDAQRVILLSRCDWLKHFTLPS